MEGAGGNGTRHFYPSGRRGAGAAGKDAEAVSVGEKGGPCFMRGLYLLCGGGGQVTGPGGRVRCLEGRGLRVKGEVGEGVPMESEGESVRQERAAESSRGGKCTSVVFKSIPQNLSKALCVLGTLCY